MFQTSRIINIGSLVNNLNYTTIHIIWQVTSLDYRGAFCIYIRMILGRYRIEKTHCHLHFRHVKTYTQLLKYT